MGTPAIGALGELLVEPGAGTPTFDGSSERYEILSEGIQAVSGTVERDGFRGSRSLQKDHVKQGIKAVGGQITINPSPADLALWLPRIMRKAAAGNNFLLGDSTTAADVEFAIMIDRVTDVFQYESCQVARATFRGSPGQLLQLTLDIVGEDEKCNNVDGSITWPVSPPAWGSTLQYEPYIYHEGVLALTADASADDPFDFELVIDNAIGARFVMSKTATEFSPSDRIITLALTFPWDADHVDMYRQADNAGVTVAGGTLTFTNGAVSTLFTIHDLRGGDASPTLNSKGELRWQVAFRARSSAAGAEDELVIVNDSTP